MSPINLEEEMEIREQELKKYFRDRICQLIIEAHEAQSKYATYLSEVNNSEFFIIPAIFISSVVCYSHYE